ncbi:MAG: hypothetical protein ACFFCE_02250 [Promethearchaeota archaeon]
MSSGKIEGNFFKNVQSNLFFNESAIFSDFSLHKSIRFNSNLIIKDLKKDFFLEEGRNIGWNAENHFRTIKKIHYILKNSSDLTQKQKYNYCNKQRLFMKLYLQRISKNLGD